MLQTRTFERLGDTRPCRFVGKIVAATNKDLPREIQGGRFRRDFYYRLCADMIETPSLAEQLRGAPGELGTLVLFLAERIVGPEEGPALAGEVTGWIEKQLPPTYPWPGNVRELEQCVRNVLIRREYRPPAVSPGDARATFLDAVSQGALTADALLARYCSLVYAETGSYQETARRLGIDRRTVRSKVDPAEVEALRGGGR